MSNLTGDIWQDAPALAVKLSGIYSADQCSIIFRIFNEVSKRGGSNEGPVLREEGVNFNSRPARIAQIIMSESHEKDVDLLIIAMQATVDVPAGSEESFPNLLELPGIVAGALLLDGVRHMHMSTQTRDVITNRLKNASEVVKKLAADQLAPELVTKIEHAIDQQERRLK